MYKLVFVIILMTIILCFVINIRSENFKDIQFMCDNNFELTNGQCYEKCKPNEIAVKELCVSKKIRNIINPIRINKKYICPENYDLLNNKCYKKCNDNEITNTNFCLSKRQRNVSDPISRSINQTNINKPILCGPNNSKSKCSKGQCCSVFGQCGTGIDYCVTYKRKDNLYDGEVDENTEMYIKLVKNPLEELEKYKKQVL